MADRLLQPGHVGPEDGCGGPQRAGEGEISCSGTADGPVSGHMDAGGVSLVYLPLRWRSPDWGERKLERVRVNLLQTLSGFSLADGSAGLGLSFLRGLKGALPCCADSHHAPPAGDPQSSLSARPVPVFQTDHLWSFFSGLSLLHAGGGISTFIKNLLE